jgi:hypothetical protein
MPNKTGANNQHFDISWQIEQIQQFESDKTAIEHKQHLVDEKERIESIPLNELSFKDFYKFPFYKNLSLIGVMMQIIGLHLNLLI